MAPREHLDGILADLKESSGRMSRASAAEEAISRMASAINLCFEVFAGDHNQRRTPHFPTRQEIRGRGDASTMASWLRWRLGADEFSPLFELSGLLESSTGAVVLRVPLGGIASAGAVVQERAFLFLPPNLKNGALYALARESFSLLRRRAIARPERGALTLWVEQKNYSPAQRHAAAAAAQFLVPTRALAIAAKRVRDHLQVRRSELGDIELLLLSRIFGVEFLVLARECERAELLPHGAATAINQHLVEEFGGPEKRADAAGLPGRPSVNIPVAPPSLLSAISQAAAQDSLRLNDAAARLGVAPEALQRALE